MQDGKNITYMQYMGTKNKLLDWIMPFIMELMENKDGYFLDLMSGSCSISSHLKQYFNVITNDVQYYSYVISKAIVENDSILPDKDFLKELIKRGENQKIYNFFLSNYSNKYFTEKVCKQIDNISYEIDKLDEKLKYIYKYILILSMNKIRLTTGHYAQYLDNSHPRMKIFLDRDLYEQMFQEIDNFKLNKNHGKNISLNHIDKDLFNVLENTKISLIYLDPPYSAEQYSRFYHILETVTKYDNPEIDYKTKGLYRIDRFKSDFCYKKKALGAFDKVFKFAYSKNSEIIISYSDKGVVPIDEIKHILMNYYNNVKVEYKNFFHSSLSKGLKNVNEVLIIGSGLKIKKNIKINPETENEKNIINFENYEKDLIRYIGNKRKLLRNFYPIFKELKENGNNTFIDLFSGSGSISRLAKGIGFKVTANDWEEYSYIINKAFLEFDKNIDTFDKVGGLDFIINKLNNLKIKKGFFYENFSDKSKEKRMFFTGKNAGKIDAINEYINFIFSKNLINELEFYYLKACLINAMSNYANITGVFRAYLKQFNNKSGKDIVLNKIFTPNGKKGLAIKKDAEKLKYSADIAYIDPPYNEHQYSPNYHILNHIFSEKSNLKGIAGVYDYSSTKSNFCNEEGAKNGFINILKNINAKHILVSYNNNGLIRGWELYEILSIYGNTEIKIIDYPRYRSHSERAPFVNENYEYLFICNVGEKINKLQYKENLFFLKSHPGYNRRRKDDKGRFEQRKGI